VNTRTSDRVLAAIADARTRRDQADRDIRILLAYARELTAPRPYRLADLAAAAGMSLSGVRTAYTRHDTETAQRILHAVSDGHSHDQHPGGQQRELPA
jgi:AraC-like DNA-binding protein